MLFRSGASPAASLDMPTAIGDGEGALNLIIWAGYAERGAADKNYDWVTPFETSTGCKVTTIDMTEVADLVQLIRERDDVLDELVMAAELAVLYRDDRARERLRRALLAWREASGDPR